MVSSTGAEDDGNKAKSVGGESSSSRRRRISPPPRDERERRSPRDRLRDRDHRLLRSRSRSRSRFVLFRSVLSSLLSRGQHILFTQFQASLQLVYTQWVCHLWQSYITFQSFSCVCNFHNFRDRDRRELSRRGGAQTSGGSRGRAERSERRERDTRERRRSLDRTRSRSRSRSPYARSAKTKDLKDETPSPDKKPKKTRCRDYDGQFWNFSWFSEIRTTTFLSDLRHQQYISRFKKRFAVCRERLLYARWFVSFWSWTGPSGRWWHGSRENGQHRIRWEDELVGIGHSSAQLLRPSTRIHSTQSTPTRYAITIQIGPNCWI